MLINSSGNVGIDNVGSNPATRLDVGGFMRTTLGAVFQVQVTYQQVLG